MNCFYKDTIEIPKNWNGNQAKAVWELLEDISSAIWSVHEEKILEADEKEQKMIARELRGENVDDFDNDDYPF